MSTPPSVAGAGKTSLLNALCGRAFYGTVEGRIWINGIQASIEEHKDAVGFVPQDDTVYAELTVKENLIYSGKFRSERSTDYLDIEDYADVVLAKLGLTRVANTIVGDVSRRGVSGGEKKRVNIGIELMGKVRGSFCRPRFDCFPLRVRC
jgi:ABC-type multidrug transport system ATPase subunit